MQNYALHYFDVIAGKGGSHFINFIYCVVAYKFPHWDKLRLILTYDNVV